MNTPGVMPHQKVTTIVENVEQARQDIKQAFDLLAGAKERLARVLGDGVSMYYGALWPYQISDLRLRDTAQEVDTFVTRNAWRYILQQTGVTHYMTKARTDELHAQLEKGAFPALTTPNVLSTVEGLTGQVGTLLLESVREVFDWLRPQYHHGVGALKTNKKFKVGAKVILGQLVEYHGRGDWWLSAYHEPHIRALGNVLSLLDGQGVQRYPQDLVTQWREGLRTIDYGACFTVPYMTCRAYKNGHVHCTFTRQDLIDKLNQLGKDNTSVGDAA